MTMTSLAFEELSKQNPEIGWIHAYPGFVVTSIFRGLPAPLRVLSSVAVPALRCLSVPIEECGSGFAWLSTDEKFKRGLWLVNWKGETMDTRAEGVKSWINTGVEWWGEEKRRRVWAHTEDVFRGVKPV